ncbi:MAG: methylenetetrahydrofolate reductase [NAD(P)H] [Syntrophales bacterium]|nr:methylenetetrahydrofolate reductase [NAD(P)H] [Syntrophales bacterium]MDD5532152.1 methylenetetrahydrofolate reductase [NAD(P)H] [Syntrophales bacterium]
MKICDLLEKKRFTLSFEVFPPVRDGSLDALFRTIRELKGLSPDFISVTYGAGGSTRDMSLEIASKVKNEYGQEVLAHLTCVDSKREDIGRILGDFRREGIENILALRGDPPKGEKVFSPTPGGFGYANELVEFIRDRNDFCIGVAGYPEGHIEAPGLDEDIIHLKRKVDAGADFIITQLFLDNGDFYRFRDLARARGISIPIIPGVFPILNVKQIPRIISLGVVKIPKDLERKMSELAEKPEEMGKYGIDFAIRQVQDLIRNEVRGLHLYSMNRSGPVISIVSAIGFKAKG